MGGKEIKLIKNVVGVTMERKLKILYIFLF